VAPVHGAVAAKLAGQDQDQEVKDAAIAATAALVATLGDELRSQVPALLQASNAHAIVLPAVWIHLSCRDLHARGVL